MPVFLSRIYLAEMTVSKDEKGDQKLALYKIKYSFPLQDRSCLLERLHRPYMGHLSMAKLFNFISKCFFWTSLYKDVKNVCNSCITSA